MPENFRPHVVMGIIILLLALALIILSFIPKRIQIQKLPASSGLVPFSSQPASVVPNLPPVSSALLVIPPLTFVGVDR